MSSSEPIYSLQKPRSQEACFSFSFSDIAAFKRNSSLQFKEGPTSPNIKEIINHYTVSERIIIDLYTHKHMHTHMTPRSINRDICCPFCCYLLWVDDILQLLKHILLSTEQGRLYSGGGDAGIGRGSAGLFQMMHFHCRSAVSLSCTIIPCARHSCSHLEKQRRQL